MYKSDCFWSRKKATTRRSGVGSPHYTRACRPVVAANELPSRSYLRVYTLDAQHRARHRTRRPPTQRSHLQPSALTPVFTERKMSSHTSAITMRAPTAFGAAQRAVRRAAPKATNARYVTPPSSHTFHARNAVPPHPSRSTQNTIGRHRSRTVESCTSVKDFSTRRFFFPA